MCLCIDVVHRLRDESSPCVGPVSGVHCGGSSLCHEKDVSSWYTEGTLKVPCAGVINHLIIKSMDNNATLRLVCFEIMKRTPHPIMNSAFFWCD